MTSLSSVVIVVCSIMSLRTCDAFQSVSSPYARGFNPRVWRLEYSKSSHTYPRQLCNRKASFIRSTSTIELYTSKERRETGDNLIHRDDSIPKVKRKRSTQPSYLEMTASSTLPLTERVRQRDVPPVGINIFQQFTPSYAKDDFSPLQISEFINDFTQSQPQPITSSKSKYNTSILSLNTNILCLLSDDEGEEDSDIPDASNEAANQIADKSIYFRISDEAKEKASRAVQKKEKSIVVTSVSDKSIDDFDKRTWDMEEATGKKLSKTKVTANVQETGMDTMRSYVKSLGQHQLLPKDSEVLLGKQIQILMKWEEIRQSLEKNLSAPPTFGQWADALQITVPNLKKQIRKSQRAKAALIEANLRLVVTVARQSVKQGRSEINFQDACQEGIIGLTKACEKFDPERGFRFSTYAIWWIKREVHRSITEQGRSIRLPSNVMQKINEIRINERVLMNSLGRKPTDEEVAEKSSLDLRKLLFYRKVANDAISLDKKIVAKIGKGSSSSGGDDNGKTIENIVKDSGPTPLDLVNKEMLRDDVRNLIKTLSPREQVVIRLRFGLDDGTPRTLDYIGKKFSVETDQVRKIEARALLKLRQPYRIQSVRCYEPDL